MRYLSVEKRVDGAVQVIIYINADGSPTHYSYDSIQDAIVDFPMIETILSKNSTGMDKDSNRADVYFKSDGKIDRVESHVFSVSINEETKKTLSITDSAKLAVVDLANDILVEEGKPRLGDPKLIDPRPAADPNITPDTAEGDKV